MLMFIHSFVHSIYSSTNIQLSLTANIRNCLPINIWFFYRILHVSQPSNTAMRIHPFRFSAILFCSHSISSIIIIQFSISSLYSSPHLVLYRHDAAAPLTAHFLTISKTSCIVCETVMQSAIMCFHFERCCCCSHIFIVVSENLSWYI